MLKVKTFKTFPLYYKIVETYDHLFLQARLQMSRNYTEKFTEQL